MKNIYLYSLRSIPKDERGLAFIEFAISLGVLLVMFFGAIEIPRYFLIIQKLEKSIATVTDVVTRANQGSRPLSDGQITDLMVNVSNMMSPYVSSYANASNIYVILTDVYQEPGKNPSTGNNYPPIIQWQVCGGGTLGGSSTLGTGAGTTATLPAGFNMNNSEEAVFGEIFYAYRPITNFTSLVNSTLYRMVIYSPRFGSLSSFAPGSNLCN